MRDLHYSLILFGHARIPIINGMHNQATEGELLSNYQVPSVHLKEPRPRVRLAGHQRILSYFARRFCATKFQLTRFHHAAM